MPRIYLDNAATSHPKPESVYAAVDYYNRSLGAAAGRGGYRTAVEVDAVLRTCRKRAASLLGAESPERVAFAFNATDALNMALHGLLETGDHVVTTAAEHNSVLRPLGGLVDRRGIELSVVPVDAAGRVDPAAVRDALRHNTRLVVVQHASNVTGCVQPIEDIGSDAHQAGALVLVDAAQTAGHLAIDLADWPVDLLACAGPKGLLGPLGTGLLYVRPGLEDQLNGLRQGGTGSFSEQDRQPETMPDRLEAGNPNAPGLFGLEAVTSAGSFARQTNDYRLLSKKRIKRRLRYTLESQIEFTRHAISESERIAALQLPSKLHPRTRLLAADWRARHAGHGW